MTFTGSPEQSSYIPEPQPQPPRRHRARNILLAAAGGGLAAILGAAVAVSVAGNPAAPHATASPATTAPAPAAPETPAAQDTPPPPAGPETLAMGDPAVITQGGADAATITVSHPVTAATAADQYGSAPARGYFVTVTAVAAADPGFTGGFDVYSGDFYARTPSGGHYAEGGGNAYSALSDSSAELGYTTLAAGETVSGKLVFDVPSPHGQIVYAPNYDGQPLAEWEY